MPLRCARQQGQERAGGRRLSSLPPVCGSLTASMSMSRPGYWVSAHLQSEVVQVSDACLQGGGTGLAWAAADMARRRARKVMWVLDSWSRPAVLVVAHGSEAPAVLASSMVYTYRQGQLHRSFPWPRHMPAVRAHAPAGAVWGGWSLLMGRRRGLQAGARPWDAARRARGEGRVSGTPMGTWGTACTGYIGRGGHQGCRAQGHAKKHRQVRAPT